MTYADNQWLSAYTYQAILARLLEEDALGPLVTRDPMKTEIATGLFVHVVATINKTAGDGKIT
jgi:hypothetical protein